MKRFFQPVNFAAAIACAGGLAFATAAGAVDVKNDDDVEYEVTLTESGGTGTLTLEPGEEKLDVCAICEVSIDGAEPVEGAGLDRVVIRGGELHLEEHN